MLYPSCQKGGFPSIRHNEIRDLTANLLTEVCSDVCIEAELQPVTEEVLTGATSNTEDGARLGISANGFWGGGFKRTYFYVQASTLMLLPLTIQPTGLLSQTVVPKEVCI